MLVFGFMNVNRAGFCSDPKKATVAYSVRMVTTLVHQFRKVITTVVAEHGFIKNTLNTLDISVKSRHL
jgi:hypothetical protein|tara:strand:- start:2510 stop:2713 length:204 start_codon:yes stop_codon:yes gene_type:complete